MQMLAKPVGLIAGSGHDRQEPSVADGNEAHVLSRAKFAVRHVEEVRVAADSLDEQPGIDVNGIVGGVAIVGLGVDGHGTVGGDGDAVKQLLEIGAVILVVTEGNVWWPVRLPRIGLVGVLAGDGNGGGILVDLPKFDGELANDTHDEYGEETGSVGSVEVIESSPDAIVVEQSNLLGEQSQVFGYASCGPFGKGIEWPSCDDEVGQKHSEGNRCGQCRTSSRQVGKVLREQLCDLQTLEEMPHDGCGTDLKRFEGCLLPDLGHGKPPRIDTGVEIELVNTAAEVGEKNSWPGGAVQKTD